MPTPVRDDRARLAPWRRHLHTIVFEADTTAGFAFDVVVLAAILASVGVVVVASVAEVHAAWGPWLHVAEWAFTVLFTVEYVLRLVAVARPVRYVVSFYGLIDLVSLLPTWIGLFVGGTESLLVVRLLRLARLFRVFKLVRYVEEGRFLLGALRRSARKITVFMTFVLALVTIVGALAYVIEGPERGFTSIPTGMYWAVVTITTVGYGDISPQSPLGRLLAAVVMLVGYAILAVPTGIVGAEMLQARRTPTNTQACPACAADGHDDDAVYCRRCGTRLDA